MADYYVREEDGTSRYILEDSSGDYLLELQPTVDVPFVASATALYTPTVAYTGQQNVVTAPGTYQWLCPVGVTLVYVECVAGGGGGPDGSASLAGAGGGGGGAYASRVAVPVTPGTLYTFTVGAGGVRDVTVATDGGDSSFTGDSSVQVVAKGGSGGVRAPAAGGPGGSAASSIGDVTHSGGDGFTQAGSGQGGGGGASGNRSATGASATARPGAAGANGGGSGGDGGLNGGNASPGSSPGGGSGGGGQGASGASGAAGSVTITAFAVPFIASVTTVYPPAIVGDEAVPFISSATAAYAPTLVGIEPLPFIASVTAVFTPTLVGAATEVDVPFIASRTRVWSIFSFFDPNRTFSGPGNGGETFLIRLNANGVTSTATLAANITDSATALELTGDGSLPSTVPFMVTIDDEVLYVVQLAPGSYRIRARRVSNTLAAAHTAGATVSWGDSYDLALVANSDIAHEFTADIASSGSFIYPGWLITFDSTQAYLAGARYPMHVTETLGVFDAGAGSTGTNRCDAAQPNAIATPTGAASDDCPAALSNPSRISSDIITGDVALVRYTNPEATVLDLGSRAVALQSWFGLKRVDATDGDVTFTDPNGIVVDTTGAAGTFTGSVNDEWGEPIPLLTGIAPDASDDAGTPIDTPNPVPWTTVTLPGSDRHFTDGIHYNEKGWPICCIAARQGSRRVPLWQSWDWKDYSYVYTGFGTDATFAQLLINRNGIIGDLASVALPGPQDIDGPDAVWDDATYFVGASWYVAIFSTPYLVFGPGIGGTITIVAGADGYLPGVSFPGGAGGTPVIGVPPPPGVEGGSGGDITPPGVSLFQAAAV